VNWNDWITKHARIFGMQSENEMAMLAEWANLFTTSGYTPEEMAEASQWVALNCEVRFRADLLPRLLSRAKDAALRATAPRRIDPGPQPTAASCSTCGGRGKVQVPDYQKMAHPIYAHRYWYDLAVACRCPLGEWHCKATSGTVFALRSLADYEAEHPHWREDAAQNRREEEAYQRALDAAKGTDSQFGQLVQRLITKAKKLANGGGRV